MKMLKLSSIGLLALFATLFFACKKDLKSPDLTSDAKISKMDVPKIECAGSTQTSISITVTAGPNTGAPAGFSLQWMTAEAFAANGNQWYASDDARLCKASFSGNANLSRYNLGKGESVTVKIGEFLFDEGASTNCDGALKCGTAYVFRAFAHANNTLNRSDFSANLTCSTLTCGSTGTCTYTQGYWKTHGAAGPASERILDEFGNITGYVSVWPVHDLALGTVSYTEQQLQSIFDTPAGGNGLIALAHQLIAAKLNIANGADGSAIAADIAAADALIGGLVVPPVGTGYLAPSATGALITALANYNEGATGPGHCE